MAFVHGKKSVFKIDATSGASTTTDISAYLDEVQFSRDIDTAETTTLGNNAKTYVVGLSDATISLSGKWDSASSSTIDQILTAHLAGQDTNSITWDYIPGGGSASATNPRYSGEAYLTSYEIDSPVDDVISFSAELQVTGAITRNNS